MKYTMLAFFRFHRGQPVFLESKEAGKVSAVINCVGTQEVSNNSCNECQLKNL